MQRLRTTRWLIALAWLLQAIKAAGYIGKYRREGYDQNYNSEGYGVRPTGPNRLLNLDFTIPSQQSFPTTAAALAALMGGGLVANDVEEIWNFTESSGNFVGEVASTALVPVGSDLVHETPCVGLFNGTDPYSLKGVRFDVDGVTTNRAQDAGTTIGNITIDEKLGVLLVFRVPKAPAATRGMFLNRSAEGWSIRVLAGGTLAIAVDGKSATVNVTIAKNHCDGAWHYALATIDTTTGSPSVNIFSDLGSGTPNTTDLGDTESTAGVAVGGITGIENHTIMQVKYAATFRGKTMTAAMGTNFWKHGGQNFSPQFDTFTRASLCTSVVGIESGFGERVAKWSGEPTVPQFAYGYNALFSHGSKMGALFEPSAVNLCLQSENQSTTWTQSNVTVTANDAEAPDGTQTADKLVATADNGYSKSGNMITVAATKYVESIWIKRVGGSDVSGRLIQYDESGAAEDGALVFSADDEWQRLQIAPTAAGSTSTSFRIEIDTSGEGVYVWGAQTEANDEHATSYIVTTTGSATRSSTAQALINPGGTTYYKTAAGEIQAVFIPTHKNRDNDILYLWTFRNNGGGDNDLHFVRFGGTGIISHSHYDSSGVVKQSVNGTEPADWAAQENVFRYRWDSENVLEERSENADMIINDVRAAGAAVTWTGANNADRIYPFNLSSGVVPLAGLAASFQIWDGPRAE